MALALGAGVACSDPRAGSLPPPMPSTTPTSPVTTPSAWADPETAFRDAIAHYYEALTAAANDPAGRTDDLERLISPSCSCRAVIDLLRDEAAKGHRLDYEYGIEQVKVIDVQPTTGHARYVVVQTPGRLLDDAGRVLARYPGSRQKFAATFVLEDGRWLLHRANQVD